MGNRWNFYIFSMKVKTMPKTRDHQKSFLLEENEIWLLDYYFQGAVVTEFVFLLKLHGK